MEPPRQATRVVNNARVWRLRKNGKTHTYWALVESYRTARGSRQRLVAYLGELKRSEKSGWAQLGRKLSGKAKPQRSLFDPPHYDDPGDDEEPVLVRLKGIALERVRDFGVVWLALGLWRLLELDEVLDRLIPGGREEVPWATVAAMLAVARFCQPQSELHIEDTWYEQTALDDLLGVPVEKVHTDRLYAGMDRLLQCKEALEKHLRDRLGNLFALEYDLLLYDVTSTYFEGTCGANTLAKRGYSRDGRPQCLQVCIALVVTTDGIPLGYEVFAGDRTDVTTVEEIVLAMEKKCGHARADLGHGPGDGERKEPEAPAGPRGLVSRGDAAVDAAEIRGTPDPEGLAGGASGRRSETRAGSGRHGDVRPGRSADRRQKEAAIHRRFVERFEAALEKMQAEAASGRLKELDVANRRLGAIAAEVLACVGGLRLLQQADFFVVSRYLMEEDWLRSYFHGATEYSYVLTI